MNALLIEQLTSTVRKKCIECRARAMMGSAQAALTALDEMLATADLPELDHVCIALLKAEILAAEDREDQALEVFREHIDPKLDRLSPEHALIIADNRHIISIFLERTSGRDFYLAVDARRIANIELWESSPLLDAAEAAAEGNHHEALPLVWSECLRAYRTGSWRSQIVNTRHLARECLLLGAVDEAALQAIIGEDDKLGKKIGDELLSRGDRELIEKTVGKLVRFGNLSKHALVACEIFTRMVDAIPDAQVNTVFQSLLSRAGISPDDWPKSNSLKATWEALRALAPRLETEQAERLVRAAVSHKVWRQLKSVHRGILFESLLHVVHKLGPAMLRQLAANVIPIVTELRDDIDYIAAINLAYRVAEHLSFDERAPLMHALYPAGGGSLNLVLMQVAELFGHMLDAPVLAAFARDSAEKIRRQVQRLSADEQPTPIPGMLVYLAAPQGDTQIVVHEGGGLIYGAIRRLRHSFTPESLQDVVEAMLAMIQESENFLHNKAALVDCIGDLADCLSSEVRIQVVDTIAPLATGSPIREPTIVQTSVVVNHPLNPFRYHRGSPGKLRRSALEALAKIESVNAGTFTSFRDAIKAALIAEDVETRRAGFAAAQKLSSVDRSLLTGLLMGTRDSDREVCASAIDALASKQDLGLSENEWQLLLHSLRLAIQSKERLVRRAVAQSLAGFEAKAPAGLASDFKAMAEILRSDICYSVRRVFERAPIRTSHQT